MITFVKMCRSDLPTNGKILPLKSWKSSPITERAGLLCESGPVLASIEKMRGDFIEAFKNLMRPAGIDARAMLPIARVITIMVHYLNTRAWPFRAEMGKYFFIHQVGSSLEISS